MSLSSYAAAIDHLAVLGQELAPPAPGPNGTTEPRRKWDLAHMRTLAHALGDPQLQWPAILIAGTNGKGSTAATLASILTAAGCRTGLYTSPHLTRVNERMAIDGAPIEDEAFARIYFKADDVATHLVAAGDLPYPPSFFEILTAVAFVFFAEQKVDMAVLEVGLGGRLDATNIVDPLLSILTDIALDHQEYLGTTIAAITREKAGILRQNGTLITLPQHPEANQAIGEAAAALNLHAISAAAFIPSLGTSIPGLGTTQIFQAPHPLQPAREGRSGTGSLDTASLDTASRAAAPLHPNRYTVTLESEPLEVDSPLPGQHQQRNIALAIAAAVELRNPERYKSNQISSFKRYNISNRAIEQGISRTKWPGRLELIHLAEDRDLLLDVAHNPAGAWTLRAAIAQLPESRPRTLLFSCLRDKSLEEMSRILFPLFDASQDADPARRQDHIVFAPLANPRAAAVEDLMAAAHALSIPAHAAPHVAGALSQARAITPTGGLIIATGSVYLVGQLRPLALEP